MNLAAALAILRARQLGQTVLDGQFTDAVRALHAVVGELADRIVWRRHQDVAMMDVVARSTDKLISIQPVIHPDEPDADARCRGYVRRVVSSKFVDWLRKFDDVYRAELDAKRREAARLREAERAAGKVPSPRLPAEVNLTAEELDRAMHVIDQKILPRLVARGGESGAAVVDAMRGALRQMGQLRAGEVDMQQVLDCATTALDFKKRRDAAYQQHTRTRQRICAEALRMAKTPVFHGRDQMLLAAEDCRCVCDWLTLLKRRQT